MTQSKVDEKELRPVPQEKHLFGVSPDLVALIGLLIATALTYSLTFHFGWVYDDPPQIPQNPNLQWSRLGFLFTHQLWASTAAAQSRFYRPFLTLWFLINKSIFGLNPHWFHVTTVLAHMAATALAYCVARALLSDAGAALFAAAIFALHPLQVESVSWISAVNDPLAAIFCFASFLVYRKAHAAQRSRGLQNHGLQNHGLQNHDLQNHDLPTHAPRNEVGHWAVAGVLFLFALLTKEISIVLPGIVLIDLWLTLRGEATANPRSLLPALFTYGTIALGWLGFRAWVLGHDPSVSVPVPWITILLSAPKIFLFDLYHVVFPVGLSPQYDFSLIEAANGQFLLAAVAGIALLSVAILAAKRNPRSWTAFAWLILPILPTLNLRWMNQDDFIHDRYTYISMAGVALLAGSLYAWVRDRFPRQPLVRPLAGALILILASASAIQSQYWASDLSLFSRAVTRAPENEWAQLNYGSALTTRAKFSEAAPHFVRSYELQPGWRAADFAGFAYQHSGDLSAAERWYSTALQQNPDLAIAWFGLAQIRLQQHQPLEAAAYLKKAIQFEPNGEGFHYLMGTALEQASQISDAITEYKKELQLHPGQTVAREALERLQSSPPRQ
jgi:tetratricopeptide (TPR) repeat protein